MARKNFPNIKKKSTTEKFRIDHFLCKRSQGCEMEAILKSGVTDRRRGLEKRSGLVEMSLRFFVFGAGKRM